MASAGAAVKGFASETSKAAADAARSTTSVSLALDEVGRKSQGLSDRLGGLKGAFATVGGVAAAAGVAFGTKLSANLEQTQVAFTGMLGSAQDAQAFIGRLQQFAAVTPFTFTGLTGATQQLLAMGKTGDQAIDTLTVIGDAVAAIGGGEEQVQGVIKALTQMQSAGRFVAQDMNQISQQLPSVQRAAVFDVLADKMGITREAVAKLAETGQISADQGLAAIYEVMQKLPGATGAMERQSKTLTGVLSSLKDQLTIAASAGFQPLAGAIRDSVYPLLTQLGDLLKNVLTPLGAGLGDTFAGVATAFSTLAPNLVGIADAFGSLLSALGPLIPAGAQILNAVLIPLVPMVQAVAGALEFLLTSVPGVVGALQALAIAFLALKAVQGLVTVFWAVNAAMASTATAASGLAAAFGPVGLAIAALGFVLVASQGPTKDATVQMADFGEAVKKTGDAAVQATNDVIAHQIVADKLGGALKAAGMNAGDLGTAVRSAAGALNDGGAGAAEFQKRLYALAGSGQITFGQAQQLISAATEMGGALGSATTDAGVLTQAQKDLGNATSTTAKVSEDLAKAIAKAFDPLEAYKAALKSVSDAADQASKATVDAIHKRFDAQKQTLADEERAEKDSLGRQVKARSDALAAEHDALMAAIDKRQRAENEAFDQESRSQKEALDQQQRAQKEALDAQLADIDRATAQLKREEDRRYGAEKDRIQQLIDSTFGSEREGYKQQLNDLTDSHDERLSKIDESGGKQKQTLKDQLDDQQQVEKDNLDDRLRQLKDNLTDRETAEKDAETLRYNTAKTALDNEVTDLQNHLDDKYRRLKTNLDDREKAATTAEETRRTNAKTNQAASLTDYQTFLDAQTTKAEQFNRDMATIASRGGADVLDVIGKLDPAIVAQAAALGPAAFTSFLESIRSSIAAGKDFATSGVPGGVTFGHKIGHAEGHVAQIAMTGPRLWAEPETGGESYIPLALSKRSRSTSILAQTASIMGYDLMRMANGGIIGGTPGGGGFSVLVQVENHLAPGIDLGVAGRIIGERVERAVEAAMGDVARKVTVKSRLP